MQPPFSNERKEPRRMELLRVTQLKTTFHLRVGDVKAVRGISLSVNQGESVGIVGESGSGKSVSMLSLMRLLPETAEIEAESILFNGMELTRQNEKFMRKLRGNQVGIVFQDPMTALNPLFTIGDQIIEPIRIHQKVSHDQARETALSMLRLVQIPSPESRMKQYPHELSGGMRQRVMIAIAMSCNPKLLIADEPTTALDVTIQAQILDLMKELKTKLNTAIIMITHDMGVIANMCSRIIVMYGGMIVEEGSTREIFYQPAHPYTWGLLHSIPKVNSETKERLASIPGTPPDLLKPPSGCPFAPRCPYAMKVCRLYLPNKFQLSDTQAASCWLLHPKAFQVKTEANFHA
jgi:oligopeptide transport system ATP-binding protein